MMKKLLILFGIISLILGIIGVFVPLLPATPFILLAAWLFARSSDKLYNWLMHHKVFGKIVRDYHIDKSISLHAKIISLSFMWTTMLYTIAVPACGKIWLQFILAVIAIGVTIYILHFKTKQK